MMTFTTKVSFKEYRRLIFKLTYKRLALKLLVGFAAILALWIVLYYTGILDLPEPTIYQFITLGLISVAQPVILYTLIYRNYYSSNHLRETLSMAINNEEIQINGESFFMKVYWKRMYKIVEQSKWFLIYQNNFSAIIIPKASLSDEQELEIRKILNTITNVPTKLDT